MGLFDFLSSEARQKDRIAKTFALEAGLIAECPVCRGLTDRLDDRPLATLEQLIDQAFDQQDARVAVFQGDRKALRDLVHRIREELPYQCLCESTS